MEAWNHSEVAAEISPRDASKQLLHRTPVPEHSEHRAS
eukprot:CAMPEP_0172189972 /NCGR_PEP_ID=MMETSP1050-20130122/22843_1 /TAXON_ID=233186 /ORGANISM="Cryptomonas curvata, Strain CCAP979/52" /LENGTH=37 /DNA_ID= /DNA_START= /DNA_END= /DNA_ORIENTATION=